MARDDEVSFREVVAKVGSVEQVVEVIKTGAISSRCEYWQVLAAGEAAVKTTPNKRLFAKDWEQAHVFRPKDGGGSFTINGEAFDERAVDIWLVLEHVKDEWPALWPPDRQKHAGGRPEDHDWEGGLIFGAWFLGRYGKPKSKAAFRRAIEKWFVDFDSGKPKDPKQINEHIVDKLWDRSFEKGEN